MKGVLFDLDGIIADTSLYHFMAWKQLILAHFDKEIPDHLEVKTKGVSREDSLNTILNYLNISVSNEKFSALCNEKNDMYIKSLEQINETNILSGIKKLIIELKKENIKLALASASKNGPIILKKLHLFEYFDAIVNPENVKAGKPEPDIFIAAAKALNLLPSECIGIEDSVAGVTAINAAGALSIAVGGFELDHSFRRFETTSQLTYTELQKSWQLYVKN